MTTREILAAGGIMLSSREGETDACCAVTPRDGEKDRNKKQTQDPSIVGPSVVDIVFCFCERTPQGVFLGFCSRHQLVSGGLGRNLPIGFPIICNGTQRSLEPRKPITYNDQRVLVKQNYLKKYSYLYSYLYLYVRGEFQKDKKTIFLNCFLPLAPFFVAHRSSPLSRWDLPYVHKAAHTSRARASESEWSSRTTILEQIGAKWRPDVV